MVVNLYRDHARDAGDIAAQHQHHAEFAHGVGKGQHGGSDEPGARQRQCHGHKAVQRTGAQAGCRLHGARAQGLERALQRLHGERHGVDQRAHHQTGKGERQSSQADGLRELAYGPVGAHGDQQIKADDGGRQHQRQCHHGTDRAAPARTGMGQPPGQRCAQQHEQHGSHARELERQPDGCVVFGIQLHGIKNRTCANKYAQRTFLSAKHHVRSEFAQVVRKRPLERPA